MTAFLDNYEENSFIAFIQQVASIGESLLFVAPMNNAISKVSNNLSLNTLKRYAVFGAKLLEYRWRRRRTRRRRGGVICNGHYCPNGSQVKEIWCVQGL